MQGGKAFRGQGLARNLAPVLGEPVLLAMLLLSLSLVSCAGPPRGPSGEESPGKSVLKGELLAIFPGFFVHGLGHRYAGNEEKADDLLAMECYSLLTSGLGGGLVGIGIGEDAKAVEIAGWIGVGVGGTAFLGSWIYDIVFTPSEVNRANRARDSER